MITSLSPVRGLCDPDAKVERCLRVSLVPRDWPSLRNEYKDPRRPVLTTSHTHPNQASFSPAQFQIKQPAKMRTSTFLPAFFAMATAFTFDRLNKTDAALIVVDHQLGLSMLVHDYEPTFFRQSILAHAALGKLFDLPTILTTSADTGPNGALPKEIIAVRTRQHQKNDLVQSLNTDTDAP